MKQQSVTTGVTGVYNYTPCVTLRIHNMLRNMCYGVTDYEWKGLVLFLERCYGILVELWAVTVYIIKKCYGGL